MIRGPQLAALVVVAALNILQHVAGTSQRQLLQETATTINEVPKVVPEQSRRPFLAVRDPVRAASKDVQRLYEQGASISAVAYLLFGAAEPLADAPGSSPALLPYLSPTLLRLYASHPDRCGSDTVAELYDISGRLYGSDALKACYYELYDILRTTFSWVRDNIALALQEVPGQPLATAAWPDPALYSDVELMAAVYSGLSDDSKLGDTGSVVEGACGLDRADFAALVPRISSALAALHADLPLLQQLAERLHGAQWVSDGDLDMPSASSASAAAAATAGGAGSNAGSAGKISARRMGEDPPGQQQSTLLGDRPVGHARRRLRTAGEDRFGGGGGSEATSPSLIGDVAGARLLTTSTPGAASMAEDGSTSGGGTAAGTAAAAAAAGEGSHRIPGVTLGIERRQLATRAVPSNYYYGLPPSGFVAAAPSAMPALLLPLVFHVMLYTDRDGSVAPTNYDQAVAYIDRIVGVTNFMAKPANVQFYVKEVRSDPDLHPYLLLPDRMTWLLCPSGGVTKTSCLLNATFTSSTVADFPRSINVYVASDATAGVSVPLGFAWVPGSDLYPDEGYVFLTWDSLSTSGSNSLAAYNDGPNTLLHELFHHLGVRHTFNPRSSAAGCTNDDYVVDTPVTLGYASVTGFASTSTSYCMELFWGQYGGDWGAAYTRWSTTLGIPDTDMNAWADTCPARAGYDELGNYMTYNTAVCFAALGHFTPGQVQRAHLVASELNPVMYRWGQYYAHTAAPPPALFPPPPEAFNNTCRATRGNCPCKSSWTLNGAQYSFCDRTGNNNALACEVLNPAACAACNTADPAAKCIQQCSGTVRTCKKPPVPGTNMPPPPPPRPPSPPPNPPPPPPAAIPAICKMTASGCPCRSTWIFNNFFYSYCASPDGSPTLWCQVAPSCPTFNVQQPYMNCADGLTTSACTGGRVRFSTSQDVPPAPPSPPLPPLPPPAPNPPPSPAPPSPSVGAVARVVGSMVIDGACSALQPDASVATADLRAELAALAKVPSGFVSVTSLGCSPDRPDLLVANFTVYIPPDKSAPEIGNLTLMLGSTAAVRAAVSVSFQARWGDVSQSSYSDIVILQLLRVVSDGPYFVQRLAEVDSGRVEVVLPDGSLGLVCANGFNTSEASLVCKQLGFTEGVPQPPPAVPTGNASYYQSSLLLSGLSCDPLTDAQLEQCESAGWAAAGGSPCGLTSLAGVKCTGGVGAILDASLVLTVPDCMGAYVASSLLLSEFFRALADLYDVAPVRLVASRPPSCTRNTAVGSAGPGTQVLVSYSVVFPLTARASQVDAAQAASTSLAAVRTAVSPSLESRWGNVTAVGAASVVAVDLTQLCSQPQDATTRLCAAPAAAAVPFMDRKVPNTVLTVKYTIIIGSCVLAFLLLLTLILVLVARSRRKSRVKPTARVSAWEQGGGAGTASNEGGGGGGAVSRVALAATDGNARPSVGPGMGPEVLEAARNPLRPAEVQQPVSEMPATVSVVSRRNTAIPSARASTAVGPRRSAAVGQDGTGDGESGPESTASRRDSGHGMLPGQQLEQDGPTRPEEQRSQEQAAARVQDRPDDVEVFGTVGGDSGPITADTRTPGAGGGGGGGGGGANGRPGGVSNSSIAPGGPNNDLLVMATSMETTQPSVPPPPEPLLTAPSRTGRATIVSVHTQAGALAAGLGGLANNQSAGVSDGGRLALAPSRNTREGATLASLRSAPAPLDAVQDSGGLPPVRVPGRASRPHIPGGPEEGGGRAGGGRAASPGGSRPPRQLEPLSSSSAIRDQPALNTRPLTNVR